MTIFQQQELKDLFVYNPANGWFINRSSRGRAKEGVRAGAATGHRYRRIIIDYVKHYEHHLAWLYVYAEYPDEIDHTDGNRSNNAIANLRDCYHAQNCFNAKRETGQSGLRGAYLDKRNLQWYSKIQIGGQVKFLGNYGSAKEAHAAYCVAAELHFGEFAFHNRPQTLARRI